MVEPLTQGAVADPVVILKEENEPAGVEPGRIGPSVVAAVDRVGAAEEPSTVDRQGKVIETASKVAKGTVGIAHQIPAQIVMEIVGPECIQSPAPLRLWSDHVGEVARVLGDQVNGAIGDRCVYDRRELGQEVPRAFVEEVMRRVEPEAVEVILVKPVQGVLEEVSTHHIAVRTVEIDGRPPERLVGSEK